MDFTKIIGNFDARDVSFVSVTQQFNTANSMGRLTLNVLLSFAQFEREVTAERIRDKIAASKKKGMWMGGLPPMGYDAVDKKLVINEGEAETVKTLFRLYLELKSVKALKAETDRLGLVTKRRRSGHRITGGKPFTRRHLYHLLHNPIYVGEVSHKGKTYPGQHDAIIPRDTWDAIQKLLDDQAPARRSQNNVKQSCLLTGLVFDETGDRLTPTYARKGDRFYRYYISKRFAGGAKSGGHGWRLPARELETTIIRSVIAFLGSEAEWMKAVDLTGLTTEHFGRLQKRIADLALRLQANDASSKEQALREVLNRIVVQPGTISIILIRGGLDSESEAITGDAGYELKVPFHTKRRGVEAKIIIGGANSNPALPDQKLIDVVQRSFEWLRLLTEEPDWSIDKLARHSSVDPSDVTRFLPLAFLAPKIVDAILKGGQPMDLNVERLKKSGPIPFDWAAQRRLLGFENSLA